MRTIKTSTGRSVCTVQDDEYNRTYSFKRINKEVHMLRYPKQSYAYDESVVHQCGRYGVQYHVLKDKESGQKYYTWHDNFEKFGFIVDRGHGRQLALELKYWTTELPKREVVQPPPPEQFGFDL